MTSAAALPTLATTLRSLEAYVLPNLIDVTAGAAGIVSSLRVGPRQIVERGQTLATVRRVALLPGRRAEAVFSVRAPVAGVVTRSWPRPGELVGGSWPLVSMASSEDVMLVALFPPESAPRIRRGDAAAVFLAGAAGAFPATVVNVIEAPELAVAEPPVTRVVLSFPDAPASALWPGMPALVHVEA